MLVISSSRSGGISGGVGGKEGLPVERGIALPGEVLFAWVGAGV